MQPSIFQQQQTSLDNGRLISWSPDSNRIVIESDSSDLDHARPALQVWDIKAEIALFTFAVVPDIKMVKAGWSPDGKLSLL